MVSAVSTTTPPCVAHPTISLTMPTVGWEEPFKCCAQAALGSLAPGDEALIVFDGSPPPAPEWLLRSGMTSLATGVRSGPAAARNLGARAAGGDLMMFVDADVELHFDTLERIRAHFSADPHLDAVFGSYDADPAAPGVVSRFRNLLHHYTHTIHPGPAGTFWAGCGAVRRDRFLELGGFDANAYDRPCIEDIEFGMRLAVAGGKILLDPAIQCTHHKRWTLRSMLVTDIRQRAIPWSRLLVQRGEIPASLNLNLAARWSGLASILLFASLLLSAGLLLSNMLDVVPSEMESVWTFWTGLVVPGVPLGCLAVLLALNQDFYRFYLRQRGAGEAAIAVTLHTIYLFYSSLTFLAVAATDRLTRPLAMPIWLQARPRLRRILIKLGLSLLALLGFAAILKGLVLGWLLVDTDLFERWDEFQLFREGIFPSESLVSEAERRLPHFRTTVYFPYALPMFGAFFTWGGIAQGTLMVQGLSLLSLILMAAFGYRSLRGINPAAGGLGALSAIAIAGNSNALAQGQFSIACMGLITAQLLLLERVGRPLPAGLCWALAMIKPQIAVAFILPFLRRSRMWGLVAGVALLVGLSALALHQTGVLPLAYINSWFRVLPTFVDSGNVRTVAGSMVSLVTNLAPIALLLLGTFILVLVLVAVKIWGRLSLRSKQEPLLVYGICSVVGATALYHFNYDNIMLFPALLASLSMALRSPTLGSVALAVLLAGSLWLPQRILDILPSVEIAQPLIWTAVGVVLLGQLLLRPSEQA
jgi:hypothetical protein